MKRGSFFRHPTLKVGSHKIANAGNPAFGSKGILGGVRDVDRPTAAVPRVQYGLTFFCDGWKLDLQALRPLRGVPWPRPWAAVIATTTEAVLKAAASAVVAFSRCSCYRRHHRRPGRGQGTLLKARTTGTSSFHPSQNWQLVSKSLLPIPRILLSVDSSLRHLCVGLNSHPTPHLRARSILLATDCFFWPAHVDPAPPSPLPYRRTSASRTLFCRSRPRSCTTGAQQ